MKHAAQSRRQRIGERWPLAVLAATIYVPLLFTAPGEVGADTKTYLYEDPGTLLSRAASMWDPNIGFGSVTHQNIGYLFPMGPWFWVADKVGMPMWVAQRLWLGTLMFLAGVGVWFLLRTLHMERLPTTVAAFAYALTPYILTLEARLSGILLPYTGLPWMIAFAIRSVRRGGWRDPALFALVVLTVGQINATAIILAGLAPVLWFPYAVWIAKEAPFKRAAGAFLRIGLLTTLTSLWWLAGLAAQGGYGIDVLAYTETAKTVASAAVAPEILRGLGYWFFYGGDRLGPWIEASVEYTQHLWLIAATYALPILALAFAAFVRWKHRAYFAVVLLAGMFLAVGAHPWDDPPLAANWWKDLLLSPRGLAMRSTPRAIPLVALALAVFLGLGIAALARAASRFTLATALGVIALCFVGLPPLYTGEMVASNLQRPENIPSYWYDAAHALDAQSHDTRVLEVPGIDFASYRWGNTVDPVLPGLMDRPDAARELIPYGSPASADLLNQFDRLLQENTLDPKAVAPIARFLGVGDIVARNDLQYERYRVARPYEVMSLLGAAPGLGTPTGFGPVGTNQASSIAPMRDETALRDDHGQTYAPVEVFPVTDPQPIVRTQTGGAPVLLDGDGEGLVDLAQAGLVDGSELVQYAGSYATDPAQLSAALARDPSLVVTDTNRRRGWRWTGMRDNAGFTEQAGETKLTEDLTDNRLPVFPDQGDDGKTVAVYPGGVSARASSYGNPISFTPEYRAANAIDGDPRTAWQTGASADVKGEELELTFAQPVTTDHITVSQLISGFHNRSITSLDLRFDGKDTVPVQLDDTSKTEVGQVLNFPQRTFSRLELIIRGDDSGLVAKPGRPVRYTGFSEVGFSEVDVNGLHGDELVRLPTDLLTAAGAASAQRPLTFVLTRQRVDPAESVREDEELALARTWTQPTERTFTVSGAARIDSHVSDAQLDTLLGIVAPTASSTRRLPGDIQARASSAIDGDPTTAWSPAFDVAGDDGLTFQVGRPLTFQHLDLQVLADGQHSVPTHLRVDADGQTVADVPLAPVADRPGTHGTDAVTTIPVDLPQPVTGSTLTFTFDGVRDVTTTDWFSNASVRMPLGIAELGVPGLTAAPTSSAFDTGCRSDLLTVDDTPVSVDIAGSLSDAESGRPLTVTPCGFSADGLDLGAGDHVLRAAKGVDTGLDLDQLVLQSPGQGGAPTAPTTATTTGPTSTSTSASGTGGGGGGGAAGSPPPVVHVDGAGRTSFDVSLHDATPGQPFWFVLGQSNSKGWKATVDGHDLGPPQVVDGYANGWLVTPTTAAMKVSLSWTPQRMVWIALVLSALSVILCLVLIFLRPRAVPLEVEDPEPEFVERRARWSRTSATPKITWVTIAAIGLGLAFAAIIGPLAGLVTGLFTFAAGRRRSARWWLAVGSPASLAIAALYILGRQAHSKPLSAFEWPAEQAAVHQVGWVAVAFLVALIVVDLLWDGVTRRTDAAIVAAASAPTDDASLPDVDDDWLP